ncbi:unnamed protein product [Parnassius mnemosyne]
MWRKALLSFVCCLAFREALGDTNESRASSVIKGEENISRLYSNVPDGVYASSSPYTAYSFHVPTVITAPRNMRVIPVNEESVPKHNTYNINGFFKDSYGNRFVNSPQTLGFKATFPQQYLQIQELPAHLSQPLVSPPTYQLKQVTPHFFSPTQFRDFSPFARYAVSHPVVQNANIRTFGTSPVSQPNFISHNNFNVHPVAQQQSTSYKPIFSNTQAYEQFNKLKNEPKFQRLQGNLQQNVKLQNVHVDYEKKNNHPHLHFQKEGLQVAPARETKITTYTHDGDKAIVNLETKPPLHLLDISLLEPLTFDNPLVPQVQHFLPRINEATYHKLPDYNTDVNSEKQHKPEEEKTKTYDDGSVKRNPKAKNKSPKKKQKGPSKQNENDKNKLTTPSIAIKGTRYVSPEYSYEINSPNYKETYKEQIVRYNKETKSDPVHYNYNKEAQSEPIHYSYKKETQSEPIHYTYEKQVQKKPVQYSNVHYSKQPQQEKKIYYENVEHCPKQVYTFKSDNNNDEQNNYGSPHVNGESSSEDTSENYSSAQRPSLKIHDIGHEQYADAPQSSRDLVPEHREAEFAHIIKDQANRDHFQPTHKPNEHIRVNPNQHIQRLYPARNQNAQKNNYSPNQHIHEKSKRVIIRDETPEGIHSHNEKQSTETVDQEENNEENFEKAYKNAAFGFPAYESNSEDIERDIYNPETYGVPRDSSNFDIEHSPFQQYYEEGDKFPKYTHSNYKDVRDKTKEDYYLDFSINKPESMIDMYKDKVGYYKMYRNHRPDKYFGFDQDEDKGSENQSAKYSIAPTFLFNRAPERKQKQEFAKIQTSPYIYEYDYTKEAPSDNTAYGSQPHQRFKTKTQFVEPQFQYGFEPSSLPILLDSELATMASNISPENEKPETRKKVYKENWYIKKTSTSGGSPAS